jgi:hypothetical protein
MGWRSGPRTGKGQGVDESREGHGHNDRSGECPTAADRRCTVEVLPGPVELGFLLFRVDNRLTLCTALRHSQHLECIDHHAA